MSSPTVLQHTVFFYVGLQFVLHGVQEQHDLMVSQLTRVPIDYGIYSADVYYKYTKYMYISKNNLHRFTDSKAKNKVVRAYARPDSDCCLVRLLDMPEKVIADKSGHRSLDGLRAYEHPSHNLEKAAGEDIADPTRSFEDIKQLETTCS